MYKSKHNKNWKISSVSKNADQFALINLWKEAALKEIKLRKNMIKNVLSFKEWYMSYLKFKEYNDKLHIIYHEYDLLEDKNDDQKDWLHAVYRASDELAKADNDIMIGEVIRKNEKKVRQFLKHKDLKKYKTKVEIEFLVSAEHYLTSQNAKISDAIGGIEVLTSIYRSIREETIPTRVYNAAGQMFKHCKWKDLVCNKDPQVRKDAYVSFHTWQQKHRYTLCDIMYYVAMRKDQEAKLHKYKNEVEWTADSKYGIKLKDYYEIIDQTSKFAEVNIKFDNHYKKIIKDLYGLTEYEPWDKCLEVKDTEEEIDIEKAKDIALKSLSCLGEDYVKQIKSIYSKNIICWIKGDKYDNTGYCFSGLTTLDEAPIKIQWDGTIEGATTLSHEMGHNIKNYYDRKGREISNGINQINAEIPSTVNQFITMLYLIDYYKKNKQTNYLFGAYYELIGSYLNAVCRGGFICQFRDSFVSWFKSNKKINPQVVEEMYLNDKKEFFGLTAGDYKKYLKKDVYNIEKLYAYETYINCEQNIGKNYIGYFVGAIVGLIVAYKIYNGDKAMLDKYLEFLHTDDGKDPFALTKILNLPLLNPQVYTESKKIIVKIINEFIRTIKVK